MILPCLSNSTSVAPEKKNRVKARASRCVSGSRLSFSSTFFHSDSGYRKRHWSRPRVITHRSPKLSRNFAGTMILPFSSSVCRYSPINTGQIPRPADLPTTPHFLPSCPLYSLPQGQLLPPHKKTRTTFLEWVRFLWEGSDFTKNSGYQRKRGASRRLFERFVTSLGGAELARSALSQKRDRRGLPHPCGSTGRAPGRGPRRSCPASMRGEP